MKRFFIVLICIFMQTQFAFAAYQVHVASETEFNTEKPSQQIQVRVLEDSELGQYMLPADSSLSCDIIKVTDPKRGKRNATFLVKPISFTNASNIVTIDDEMYGKYSKHILSKEELKKIPPFKVMKSAALCVGSYFVKGLSVAYSFAEGVVKNENDGRIKSGVVNAYEASPLSYINKGEELNIQSGDEFYLIFKNAKDNDD